MSAPDDQQWTTLGNRQERNALPQIRSRSILEWPESLLHACHSRVTPLAPPSRRCVPFVKENRAGRRQARSIRVDHDRLRETSSTDFKFCKAAVIPACRLGRDVVHEHLHATAADESVVPAVVVIEVESEHISAPAPLHLEGSSLHFRFHAPAAERTTLLAACVHEHRGAWFLRRGASRRHQPTIDERALLLERLLQVVHQFAHAATPHKVTRRPVRPHAARPT